MSVQHCQRIIVAAILALAAHARAAEKTHFHIEPISVGGNYVVYVDAINDRGDIAGVSVSGYEGNGFVEKDGVAQTIPYPCAEEFQYCVPIPTAINEAGLVAGYYNTTGENANTYGFTWQTGSASLSANFLVGVVVCSPCNSTPVLNDAGEVAFSTLGTTGLAAGTYYGLPQSLQLVPGSGTSLTVTSINGRGTLAGIDGVEFSAGNRHVFRFNPAHDKINRFRPRFAAVISGVVINRSGEIAASFSGVKKPPHGFVRKDGQYTEFDLPVPAVGITVDAINDSGRVVGTFTDANYATHGFLYNGSVVSVIDVPGEIYQPFMAINNRGVMTLGSDINMNDLNSFRITCHGPGC